MHQACVILKANSEWGSGEDVERSGRSSSFDRTARYGLNNYEIRVQFIASRLPVGYT